MTKIANTIEAAPLRPDQETRSCWRTGVLNQERIRKVATGLATMIMNTEIKMAGKATEGILEGNASKPKTKKMAICISQVMPSKK